MTTYALVMALAVAGMARAETPAVNPTVVVMAPDRTSPLPSQQLTEALSSQLGELGVRVQLSTGPAAVPSVGTADRNVLAFVWIEGNAEALVVHFYEPAGTSLRERRIPVNGTDVASIEEVAVVVGSAARALLERAHSAASRAETPPPPVVEAKPEPVAPPAPPRPSPMDLALGYTTTAYAKRRPWQHGVTGAVALRPTRAQWLVGLAYTWLPAIEHASSDVAITLARHPTEVFVGYDVPLVERQFGMRVEGSLLADPIVRSTRIGAAELDATANSTRWSWAVSSRAQLFWTFQPGWGLFAGGGADFVLSRFEQVIDGEEKALLSPFPVRPRVHLGLMAKIP